MITLTHVFIIFDHVLSQIKHHQQPAKSEVASQYYPGHFAARARQISLPKCVDMKFERVFWVDFGVWCGCGIWSEYVPDGVWGPHRRCGDGIDH